jgi:four helix bundle protein
MSGINDHRKLDVYNLARSFNREVATLLPELKPGHADSKDNLKRAAKSITRNLAEGSGRWTIADKTHFYHVARASATECSSCLDEIVDYRLTTESRVQPLHEIIDRVILMLISLIKSLESRGGKTMGG